MLGQGGTRRLQLRARRRRRRSRPRCSAHDRVVAIFFGDGAAARGTFHEAALTAAVWKLPLVWICENNGWAISVPIAEQSPTENIADRAAAYGVPGVIVDGQDAIAVHDATARGGRPRPRRRGADPDRGEDAARPRPLRGRQTGLPRGPRRRPRGPARPAEDPARADLRPTEADRLEAGGARGGRGGARGGAGDAAGRARTSSPRGSGYEHGETAPTRPSAQLGYARAINQALGEEMRRDEKVWMLGQDVGKMGGVFGVTRGLLRRVRRRAACATRR